MTEPTVEPECPTCKSKRENFQGAGMLTFFSSLFSCGTLTPFTLPLTIAFVITSTIKCKKCRMAKKEAKRQAALEKQSQTSSESRANNASQVSNESQPKDQ